ncbi:MAG: hypothetical protein HKL86_03950 [Acidimicrobiaceae bacterium]|nr:hypothetical protein [Acidimicrobiaceae bacterium]
MRYLTIVRHCKASSVEPGSSDYDRPLNKRGRDQAARLRQLASDQGALGRFGPTTALVSSSARTQETFRLAFDGTGFALHRHFSDLIYNGLRNVSPGDLIDDLSAIDPVTSSLLVVAHNPTVFELVAELATRLPEELRHGNYPLGGAFVFELPEDRPVELARYEMVASYVPD